MKLAWEIFIDILEVAIIYDFLIEYLGYRAGVSHKYIKTLLWGTASFIAITVPSLLAPLEIASTLFSVLINYLMCVRLLNGRKRDKAFLSVFIMVLVAISAILGFAIFGKVIGINSSELIDRFSKDRAAALIFVKILLIWLVRIIIKNKVKSELTVFDFIALFCIPLFSIVSMFVLWNIAFKYPELEKNILLNILLIVLIDVMTFVLFRIISADNKEKQEYALLKMQYDCVQNTSAETQRIYEKMQHIRHDMKNHLCCIDDLAERGKSEEIREYIHNLLKTDKEVQKTIIFTPNSVLDSVLNIKLSLAEAKGIDCTVYITYSQIPISSSDICVLMGNLLDNAIEAAEKAIHKKILINIVRQGEFVYIRVENSIFDNVLENNPDLSTTKKDKKYHGFGISNIEKIINQYDGIIDFNENKKMFSCDIMLPITTSFER